jgi:hypothetical protein
MFQKNHHPHIANLFVPLTRPINEVVQSLLYKEKHSNQINRLHSAIEPSNLLNIPNQKDDLTKGKHDHPS